MEAITTLNQRLIDHFGLDTDSTKPMFRIVWADDQLEKRMMDTLDSGIQLLYPVVREVKKYSYLREVWVLESLAKYKDNESTPEAREERVIKLQEELFGDESGLYGKTAPGAHEGIVVPPTYVKGE